ncbi:hypothetical protein AB1Y20_014354 [Prymnesium parvum]|uniref:Uncharacterized protein n=1 Tax=Prymnesium parvum TaxID=97485 RepID=A0AB34IGZ1_PRYPA
MFLYHLVNVLRLLLLSLIFSVNVVADGAAQRTATDVEYRIEQLINSYRCRSFYLDVGTNVGVQIRKLFEPQLSCAGM